MTVERAARNAARSLRRTPEAVVRAAANEIKREIDLDARQVLGADMRMRNLRNVRITSKVTVTRWGLGAIADVEPATARARAPWRWLTEGTKEHVVPRRNRRNGRRKRPLAMQVNGQWATGPFRVRGVRPRGIWWTARRSPGPKREALRAFNEEMRRGS